MRDENEDENPQTYAESPSGSHVHPEPPPDLIRERAYEIYINRGELDGGDLEDWLRAERELRIEMIAVHCRTCQENK
jgi:hypothetical protein